MCSCAFYHQFLDIFLIRKITHVPVGPGVPETYSIYVQGSSENKHLFINLQLVHYIQLAQKCAKA